jgi:RNA polymerase sigma-70 factor (ECF subfamily)
MQEAALMVDIPRAVSDSFDQVVHQREAQVLRTAYRMLGNWADAEDVAQEVFLRLHRHGLGFANEAACGGWLYRVTVNLCLDRARSARPTGELPDVASHGMSAEGLVIREEQKQALMAALARLPPRERAAIVLREIEGLSSPEVAAILGSTDGTVRSQVARAMTRLRTILKRENL